ARRPALGQLHRTAKVELSSLRPRLPRAPGTLTLTRGPLALAFGALRPAGLMPAAPTLAAIARLEEDGRARPRGGSPNPPGRTRPNTPDATARALQLQAPGVGGGACRTAGAGGPAARARGAGPSGSSGRCRSRSPGTT